MCGIAGFARVDVSADTARRRLAAMQFRLRHRGPDGHGVHVEPGIALAHTRLAIVDLAHGAQPMTRSASTIVYNGEVYNAPALRAGMVAQGVSFQTRSDTEVVLRCYEREPGSFESQLDGMWALAIHDRFRRRLVLSRDRFGIKPLFVTVVGSALAFASEISALREAGDVFSSAFEVDPQAAHAMLSWAYVPGERTIYRGVKRLPPGSRLELDLATGQILTRRYYEPRADRSYARVSTVDEAADAIAPLVARATRAHLESDVPVACFLSGGIDSSLVLAGAVDAGTHRIEAFSIGFEDARFDESGHARTIARQLGLSHHVEVLDERQFLAALPDVLVAYDEPFGDSSSLATYLLSAVVSRTHKVALGGDGGDEVFAGYRKHQILRIRRALDRVPGLRDAARGLAGVLPDRNDRTSRWGELLRTARRIARGLGGTDAEGYLALTQVASLELTASLAAVPTTDSTVWGVEEAFDALPGTPLQRTLISDLGNVLPNDMLTKVDRASMSCRLEVRVPLLDHRLVEAGLGLPAHFTLGTRGKEVLRRLFERRFGAALASRRKQGFAVPVERWLRTSLGPACDRLFEADRLRRYGLLSPDSLAGGRYRGWLDRHPYLVWHAFALAAWCEVNLGEGPEALRALLAGSAPSTTGWLNTRPNRATNHT
ncbi:MAG: asparagine synthase (glutamine-hydrolyzing) [Kofleriaceae bacterium]|nr:asparagine synthase (glutamine-hydrolyzing) [Kofleriaceae bacterium]